MWFFGSSCIQGSLTAYWWISCWMILFCFTPPVPTIASLEINSLGAAFGASADANFPFKTPLNIRALDAGGEVITDGPDSILVRRQWGIVDWQSKHLCKRILYGCLTSCLFVFFSLSSSPSSCSPLPPPLFSGSHSGGKSFLSLCFQWQLFPACSRWGSVPRIHLRTHSGCAAQVLSRQWWRSHS